MTNQIVSVHAGICGMGIYGIMLPSSGFSVAHCLEDLIETSFNDVVSCVNTIIEHTMVHFIVFLWMIREEVHWWWYIEVEAQVV